MTKQHMLHSTAKDGCETPVRTHRHKAAVKQLHIVFLPIGSKVQSLIDSKFYTAPVHQAGKQLRTDMLSRGTPSLGMPMTFALIST